METKVEKTEKIKPVLSNKSIKKAELKKHKQKKKKMAGRIRYLIQMIQNLQLLDSNDFFRRFLSRISLCQINSYDNF